jgi:hypothetical protein
VILEGTIHCEGPECQTHQHVGADTMEAGRLPGSGWLKVIEYGSSDREFAYCGWNCLMKAAAKFPPPEQIPWDEALGEDAS